MSILACVLLGYGYPVWAVSKSPVPSASISAPAPKAGVTTIVPAEPIATPTTHAPMAAHITIAADERQFFQLGYYLAKGAFAYADVAKQAASSGNTHSRKLRIKQLAAVAPLALRDRAIAHDSFMQAAAIMGQLQAPPNATLPLTSAVSLLAKPLTLTSDARAFAATDTEAATMVSALDEFERLSALPEDKGLRNWLASSAISGSAQVWYTEGTVIGLAEIASAESMPDLLPPAAEIATDLRGLSDWLASQLPEGQTSEQIALKKTLDGFLLSPRRKHHLKRAISPTELRTLGKISQLLHTILLSDPASPPSVTDLVKSIKTASATKEGISTAPTSAPMGSHSKNMGTTLPK